MQYQEKAEAFAASIERDCRLNQHANEDSDQEEEVQQIARRLRTETDAYQD